MNHKHSLVVFVVALALLLSASRATAQGTEPQSPEAALGTAFTYQGQLKNASGPVTGTCDFQFGLWSDPISPAVGLIGTQSKTNVTVTNGLFTVQLDFGANAFPGDARWLQIAVRCVGDSGYTTLIPRQALTAAPYALHAADAWSVNGNSGTNSSSNFLGTTDDVTLTFRVSNTVVYRIVPIMNGGILAPNIIGGINGNASAPSVYGATIAGGTSNTVSDHDATVGGGFSNSASGYATVGGGGLNHASGANTTVSGGYQNTASGWLATIGGGYQNTANGVGAFIGGGGFDGSVKGNQANGVASTIGGGLGNTITATASYAAIVGGQSNIANIDHAAIGGGGFNTANGAYSTIGGGGSNTTSDFLATVAGGNHNTAGGVASTIGGGNYNIASGKGAVVGGGGYDGSITAGNQATGNASMIGGGLGNNIPITGTYATIGGGEHNTASGDRAFVGGGDHNQATAHDATVAGGGTNLATAPSATAAGGVFNTASGDTSTVGGGGSNTASGHFATVGGGVSNIASGVGAFVGGGGHDGTTLSGNQALGNAAMIGGGLGNTIPIFGTYAAIGGGQGNTASGFASVVGGGGSGEVCPNRSDNSRAPVNGSGPTSIQWDCPTPNTASGAWSTVSGGGLNTASGVDATVGGGYGNAATFNYATVGGGYLNTASGALSTIPGGEHNTASGNDSMAAGYGAQAVTNGTFVWNDNSGGYFASTNNNQFLINAHGGVGILTNTPHDALDVNGYVRIAGLGTAGSTQLCRNASNQIATCSSSLRYKTNVADLALGLDTIAKLRPVTFNWKDSGESDLGFVAEDVNQVTSLLTTLNAQGQIEGVKYDRVTAILVKGIQEQQAQITALQQQNAEQLTQLKALQAQVSQGQSVASSTAPDVFNMFSVIALLGTVVLWRQQRRTRSGGVR